MFGSNSLKLDDKLIELLHKARNDGGTMKTRITELLNIDYPIFQGGMAWVADGDLAGAVSKAGGLGIISGGECT